MRCTAKPSATPMAIARPAMMTRPGWASHSATIIHRATTALTRFGRTCMAVDESLGRQGERTIRNRRRQVRMRHQDGCRAELAHPCREQIEDVPRRIGVEIAGRLVGENE